MRKYGRALSDRSDDMRVAALHQLAKTAAHHTEPAPFIDPESELVVARLVRCECRGCGAHTNASAAAGADITCPNCGAAGLVPVEGAGLIRTP
jgi:ribosomal protein S27E